MRTPFHAFASLTTLPRITGLALLAVALTTVGCAGSDDDDTQQGEDAFTNFPSASDIPTNSSWAIGMINKACDLDRSVLNGATGSITNVSDGVIYKATRGGSVVASAWASSTFIGAQKRCLSK